MRARCTKAFRDFSCGVLRDVGDTFDVTPERFSELRATRYGALVEEVPEEVVEEVPEAAERPVRRAPRKKATQK